MPRKFNQILKKKVQGNKIFFKKKEGFIKKKMKKAKKYLL